MAAIADTRAARAEDGVTPLRIPMTVEEFKAWYDREAGRRGEWVDGEVIVFLAPKVIHPRIIVFLTTVLGMYVQERELGEVIPGPEMRLRGDRSYREPDLLFVAADGADRLDEDGLGGPADLAVEVVSNDSVRRDRDDKFVEYEVAGVREYWLIDPRPGRRTFDAYTLSAAGPYEVIGQDDLGRIGSLVIPGLWVDPDWLWTDPIQSAPAALRLIAAE